MFGLIPRAVWSRQVQADEKGRITVQHNCLLLERIDEVSATNNPRGLPAPKLLLLEAGTGDKLDAKSRDIFALQDRTIETALHEVNCAPGGIGGVVVSHLHFDHSGGLTRAVRAGEAADWTGPASTFGASRGDLGVKRTFPNAQVVAQRREWEDGIANRSVMTKTYFTDHLAPIEPQLRLIDSPPPFGPGAIVDREAQPPAPQAQRETEVYPGVFVFRVPGHTWGQQATRFVDEHGRSVVFTPDVMPTAAHLGQAYSLAYDVEPYTSMVSRRWLLSEAAAQSWVLMLDHEAGHPVFSVRANDKGWFDLVKAEGG